MSGGRRRVLFLGFALPDDLFARVLATDEAMPVQTQRFGWSVIRALASAGCEVVPVSVEPVADFPHSSRVLIGGGPFEQDGTLGTTVPFVNLVGLKHATRFLTVSRAVRSRVARGGVDAVVVHGVHSPLLWAGLRTGARCGVPTVAILTDAPSVRTRFDTRLSQQMKRVDKALILRALARADGVVTLSPALADDFAPGRPALWMEGIASDLSGSAGSASPAAHPGQPRTVVYAGTLHASYGVLDLLDAVAHSRGSWRLVLYGRGPAEPELRAAASTTGRVELAGTVPPALMPAVYAGADLLVNPRPPDAELARHSFPSKLLEYLASGTPVLTTRLPNLPGDYEPHLFLTDPGGSGLAHSIDALMAEDPARLRAVGVAGRDFVLATRGEAAQGRRLVALLDGLSPTRRPAGRGSS